MSLGLSAAAASGLLFWSTAQADQAAIAQTPVSAEISITDAQIRDFILANPEVIIESLNAYQQRQAQEERASADVAVSRNVDRIFAPGLPHLGAAGAERRIAIFSDYRCPHCQRAAAEIGLLLQEDPGLGVVVHELPILGQESVVAARYALAVRQLSGPDAYAGVHDRLFANRGADEAWIIADSAAIGLDWGAVRSAMFGAQVNAQIEAAKDLSADLGVQGTPFIVVGERGFPGVLSSDEMRSLISEIRD